MALLTVHGLIITSSGLASLLGLVLLQAAADIEDYQHLLMSMTFGCWLVYCLAWGLLRLLPPELEYVANSLHLTAGLAYIFTFTCVLSLPLYAVSIPVGE